MNKNWVLSWVILAVIASVFVGGLYLANYYSYTQKKPITLKVAIFCDGIWENIGVDNVSIMNAIIDDFEKSNPNINVECNVGVREKDYSEWLSQKIINSETPDVIAVLPNDFSTLIKDGVLKNLDEYILNDSSFDAGEIYNSALETCKYDGSYYALPREVDPMLMFVNETLLRERNIDIPSDDWTWDDFYDICEKVTQDTDGDGMVDVFGAINFNWQVAAATNGASPFDSNGKRANFDSDEMMQAVSFVAKLNKLNKGMIPKEMDFNEGRVAFKPFPYSWYRTFKTSAYRILKYNSFDWKCIKLPKGPNGKNAGELNSYLMSISTSTKYPDECWEFLKYVTTNEDAQKVILDHSEGVSVLKTVNNADIRQNRRMTMATS